MAVRPSSPLSMAVTTAIEEYWCVEIASFMRMHTVIEYLKVYPLLTSKRTDFDAFKVAFKMALANEHLTVAGKKIIRKLKNTRKTRWPYGHRVPSLWRVHPPSMNKKRIVIDWSHLS